MATKYRIGHHRVKRSFHIKGVLFITLFLVGAVIGSLYLVDKEQFSATESQPRVSEVEDPNGDYKEFAEEYFTIGLPKDWKLESSQQVPTIQYVFRSTKRFADNRSLTIYIDTIRSDFQVSHLLPVEANNDRLILGNMSDRCSNFVGDDASGRQNLQAKWNGVNFICGLSYQNDYIVGTSSAASGINRVETVGPKTGKHILFFVYDDQNINPDTSIFQESLRSFRAL